MSLAGRERSARESALVPAERERRSSWHAIRSRAPPRPRTFVIKPARSRRWFVAEESNRDTHYRFVLRDQRTLSGSDARACGKGDGRGRASVGGRRRGGSCLRRRAVRCAPCCGGSENGHACIKQQCQIAQAAPKLGRLLGPAQAPDRRERGTTTDQPPRRELSEVSPSPAKPSRRASLGS